MFVIVRRGLLLLNCFLLSACAAPSPFPPSVTERVDPTFHFEAWRDSPPSNAAGKTQSGTTVQLGGRIVQGEKNGEGVLIVAEQLPLKTHPVFGPAEPGPIEAAQRIGPYEFAFLFPGKLEDEALRTGNRFVLVGITKGRKHVVVRDTPKSEPYLVADCIHIWQTGPSEIESFKEDVGAGYVSLPEKTYCAPRKKK